MNEKLRMINAMTRVSRIKTGADDTNHTNKFLILSVKSASSALEKIVDYIRKEAHKDEVGDFDPEDLLFVVQGEMEYADSLAEEE